MKVKSNARVLSVTPNEQEATIFVMKGSKHQSVKIFCCIDAKSFYWTCSRNQDLITLEEEQIGSSNTNQEFITKLDYGENLVGLFANVSGQVKNVKFNGANIVTLQGRLGDKEYLPFTKAAPLESTFMILPQTNDTTFYLSMNYIVNSIRFDGEKCLIRSDDILDSLLRMEKTNRGKIAIHVSSYCLCLLARSVFKKVKTPMTNEFLKNNDYLDDLCNEFVKINQDFRSTLQKTNSNSSSKEGISPDEYTHYLESLKKSFEEYDEINIKEGVVNILWRTLLDGVISGKGVETRDLRKLIHDHPYLDLPCGEVILDYLGPTNVILKSCLTKYKSGSDHQRYQNGHMTILRMMRNQMGTTHGNLMKQSLCVARHVSQEFDLEIIQDYSTSGTLSTKLDQHFKNEIKIAKKFENPCFLRILKRIQVNQCQKKDRHGVLVCECNNYASDENKPYDLKCRNCGHIHRTFESYSDLIGLPCLLILVNNGSMGDTFPPSLTSIDDRINYVKINSKEGEAPHLTQFSQEKGRLCRYTTMNSKLPVLHISVELLEQLTKSLKKDCSYYHYFCEKRSVDPKLKWNQNSCQFEPNKDHIDTKPDKKIRDHHFILIAEPQSGKTGAYLQAISLMRQRIEDKDQELDLGEETQEEGDEVEIWDPFKAIVPHWKDLENMALPTTVSGCKYTRLTGTYQYPIVNPPDFPSEAPKKNRVSTNICLQDLTIHKADHSDELCCYTRDQNTDVVQLPYFCEFELIRINFPMTPEYDKLINHKYVDPKTICIMTPSYGRHWKARLNYTHLFKTKSGDIEPYIHMVFVRKQDYKPYVQHWGNHVAIVEIPEEMVDIEENVNNGGIGYARRFIQRFCYEYNIKSFYMVDDTLLYLKQFSSIDGEYQNITMLELHQQFMKIGSTHENVPFHVRDFQRHAHLPDSKLIASYSGPLDTFGLIGARKIRASNKIKTYHAKRHCTSFFWMNNHLLVERNILFQPWKAWEDLELSNQVDASKLNVVKLMTIEFIKIHSRDNMMLYEWNDSDFLHSSAKTSLDVDMKKMEKILVNFVKTCRIKCVRGTLGSKIELEEKIKSMKTVTNGGNILVLGDTYNSYSVESPSQNYIFIFKQSESSSRESKNKDQLGEWFSRSMNCAVSVKAVFSTHKPPVKDDYWIILVSKMEQRIVKMKSPSQSDEDHGEDNDQSSGMKSNNPPGLLHQIFELQKGMNAQQIQMIELMNKLDKRSKSMDEREKELDERHQLMENRQIAMNHTQMEMDQRQIEIFETQKKAAEQLLTLENKSNEILKRQEDLHEKLDHIKDLCNELKRAPVQSEANNEHSKNTSESREDKITNHGSPRKRIRYGNHFHVYTTN